MNDLHERDLLSSTLVTLGDFGRTPRIDRKYVSRDHWPHANTVLRAGAGPAGLIHGHTDRHAAEVHRGVCHFANGIPPWQSGVDGANPC